MKHRMEVSPLSREMMLLMRNPYPSHYRMAFAFSIFLYPPACRLALRLTFPKGDWWAYHVPYVYHGRVRSRLSAGGATSAAGELEAPTLGHLPFGSSLSASLACHTSRRLSAIHLCWPYHPTL